MSKLFAFNMMTLDGYFEGPNHDIRWHNVDEEFNRFAVEQLEQIGTLVFGRSTYEMMAAYWPTPAAIADDPVVARLMNELPKIVVSRTLRKVQWSNTRILPERVKEELLALKRSSKGDVAIFGSANLLKTLMQLDLVDEHRIMLNPIILGAGSALFQLSNGALELKLVRTRSFHNGNILLYYAPSRKNAEA